MFLCQYPRRQNPRKKLTDNSVADGKNQRPITPRAEGELTSDNSQQLPFYVPYVLMSNLPETINFVKNRNNVLRIAGTFIILQREPCGGMPLGGTCGGARRDKNEDTH